MVERKILPLVGWIACNCLGPRTCDSLCTCTHPLSIQSFAIETFTLCARCVATQRTPAPSVFPVAYRHLLQLAHHDPHPIPLHVRANVVV